MTAKETIILALISAGIWIIFALFIIEPLVK